MVDLKEEELSNGEGEFYDDDNFDELHASRNRKGKKAGGWQSLGNF